MQEANNENLDYPVRILQISYSMDLGGAETLIMNIYRNIDRSKLQFDFLLHSNTESAYDNEIRSLGGKIYRIPRFLGYNKFSYDKTLKAFLLDHPEYTILHDHLMDSATETFRVAKSLGKTTISHSHIAQNDLSLSNIIRSFFRRNICKYTDYRFACSEEAGKWLYKGKGSFTVVRNGIETSKFRFSEENRIKTRKELGINEDEFAIAHIGRLVEQKNHKRLVSIFNEITALNSASKLILIGEGPLRGEIEKEVEKLNLKDKVMFLGARKDVNELLSGFDVFMLPSLFEGLPVTLVEAEASGLPCVFSDCLSEEVRLIKSLIHPVSLDAPNKVWAEKVLGVKPLEKREEASLLVEKAGFDIHDTAKKLEKFYLDVARGNTN